MPRKKPQVNGRYRDSVSDRVSAFHSETMLPVASEQGVRALWVPMRGGGTHWRWQLELPYTRDRLFIEWKPNLRIGKVRNEQDEVLATDGNLFKLLRAAREKLEAMDAARRLCPNEYPTYTDDFRTR